MRQKLPVWIWEALPYSMVCWVLYAIPLFNILHVESCAVLAVAAYIIAGWKAKADLINGRSLVQILQRAYLGLLVPLGWMTLSLSWVPNCGYGLGLGFFFLFPVLTTWFSIGLVAAFHGWGLRKARFWHLVAGLGLGLGGAVYDLGLHPQFYTYNAVFGGVLGPIYDEVLAIRPGLFWAKILTFIWGGLFFGVYQSKRGRLGRTGKTSLGLSIVLLTLGYSFSGYLGINTPAWAIEAGLGSLHQTDHFDIWYDAKALTKAEVEWVGKEHEFRYHQLKQRLGFEVGSRIQSYLYPNEALKAGLVGARRTSVAPVWLAQPQMHILLDAYAHLPHELVHVFSRSMGISGIRASRYIGLVEGFAVALEPPDGLPTPTEQVAQTRFLPDSLQFAKQPLAKLVAANLGAGGFWGGRGAVSYTTMGAFCAWLLDKYGVASFKKVYAWGDFEGVYGRTVTDLATEWQHEIEKMPASPAILNLAMQRFKKPSLFETPCPHYQPPYLEAYERATAAWEAKDSTQALLNIEKSLQIQAKFEPAWNLWAQIQLARKQAKRVLTTMPAFQPLHFLTFRQIGDAYALLNDTTQAQHFYQLAEKDLSPFNRGAVVGGWLRKHLTLSPEALQAYFSHAPKQLAHFAEAQPLLGIWLGGLYAQDKNWVAAREVFEQVLEVPHAPPLIRGWAALQTATFALRTRAFDRAEAALSIAKTSYQTLQDRPMLAYLDDLTAFQKWLLAQSTQTQ